MIDDIRVKLDAYHDTLTDELQRVRAAIVALSPAPGRSGSTEATMPPGFAVASAGVARPARRARKPPAKTAPAPARKLPSPTRAAILAALADATVPLTSGEVIRATGLGSGTVRTTLTQLKNVGVVAKADRGYQLPTHV